MAVFVRLSRGKLEVLRAACNRRKRNGDAARCKQHFHNNAERAIPARSRPRIHRRGARRALRRLQFFVCDLSGRRRRATCAPFAAKHPPQSGGARRVGLLREPRGDAWPPSWRPPRRRCSRCATPRLYGRILHVRRRRMQPPPLLFYSDNFRACAGSRRSRPR